MLYKLALLAVALALPLSILVSPTALASDRLAVVEVDYRDVVGQSWLDQVELLYVGRDYLVAMLDGDPPQGLPRATMIDRAEAEEGEYLSVHLTSPEGRAIAERLGTVIFDRGNQLLVRRGEGWPGDGFDSDGVLAIVPLRVLRLSGRNEATPTHTASTYDDQVAAMVAAVNDAGYQAAIQNLEDFITRSARTATYRDACQFVHDTFESYGLVAEIQEFLAEPSLGDDFTCWNVIAEKQGTVHPDQIYLICGHLDSTAGLPWEPESVAPGADDNGSGAAATLEAARIMSQCDFEYTLRFICFGAEEQGLLGSYFYAEDAATAGDDILGVVDLDMVLYAPPGHDTIWVPYDMGSLSLAQSFEIASSIYVPELEVDIEYDPGAAWSDHYAFWASGYAAILGIEEEFRSNPYYHETYDLLANYLEYFPFGTDCVRGAIATVASLAQPVEVTGVDTAATQPSGTNHLLITGISPNPARASALVDLSTGARRSIDLTLFDVLGRALLRQEIETGDSGAGGVRLGVAGLPGGVYLVRATDGRDSVVRRLVIAR
jgi:hypothetical protein